VNWKKAGEVGLSLFISPLIGFALAALLLLVAKRLVKSPAMHHPPEGDKPPPWWVRGILIFTCSGVSFAHGSNDGQKGIGLIMLILIGLVPASYALDMNQKPEEFQRVASASREIRGMINEPEARKALARTRPVERTQLALGPREDSPREAVADTPK